jgi:hypothetical protein
MLRLGRRDANSQDGSDADWTITWTLRPEGAGTRLFLLHEGFAPDDPLQQRARAVMDSGPPRGGPGHRRTGPSL